MSSPMFNYDDIKRNLEFIQKYPWFDERPASIMEFLGQQYLNVEKRVRPGIKEELLTIFGPEPNPKRVALFEEAMFTGAIGIGKQLRPEELVLTPAGWVENQSLSVGDSVVGSNGRPTKVLGVFRHKDVQMYRVTFKDGTWIDAGAEHLWEVSYKSSYGKFKNQVVDTAWLASRKLCESGGNYKYRIPTVLPVEFESGEPLPLAAWVMGALLANGGFTQGSVSYSTCDDWNACKLEDLLRVNGVHLSEGGYLKYTICDNQSLRRKNSNPVMQILDKLNLAGKSSKEKFIPECYLRASIEDRWQLLFGLMDNDGSQFGKNTQVYSTSSKQLSVDIAELVRSLGGYCTVTEFERNSTEYQVHVNMDQVCPFTLPRKVKSWSPRTNQRPVKSIISVEKIDIADGICIKVDAADELYVAKDYIVTHNTTMASIVIPYMVHHTLCLKDPQDFYELMQGSRIAFMQMSTSDSQAKETLFGDIKARIQYSPWFMQGWMYDKDYKNQLRFPKDVWVLPGNSQETTFEGYNILGGILDEADSHKVTEEKDYADQGFTTIDSRIRSRFQDRGFLMVVGQMKKSDGFAARKYKDMQKKPKAHTVRMTIWESLGWQKFTLPDGTRDSFFYDTHRKVVVPKEAVPLLKSTQYLIEIPRVYLDPFENAPEKALRDLAGIPPAIDDPFISLVDRITDAQDKWVEIFGQQTPVDQSPHRPQFFPWFESKDGLKRALAIDTAISDTGDALGMAMGHVREVVEIDGELKPFIVYDFLMRIKAAPGTEIILSDVRQIVYSVIDDLNFKVKTITMDGFQSTDTLQQFRKRRINADYLSVDRQKLPYEDLREAIYERRCAFPYYLVKLQKGDDETTNIAFKELSELQDNGKKIDHPPSGSKDVADAMAAVAYMLMGDRSFRRGVTSVSFASDEQSQPESASGPGSNLLHPALSGFGSLTAPIPPSAELVGFFPVPKR